MTKNDIQSLAKERRAKVIELRGRGMTLRAIAHELGMSSARPGQLLRVASRKGEYPVTSA